MTAPANLHHPSVAGVASRSEVAVTEPSTKRNSISETTAEIQPPLPRSTWVRDLLIVATLTVLTIGGAAGGAFVMLRLSNSGRESDIAALKTEVDLYLEYRSLRERPDDVAGWADFQSRVATTLPSIVKRLEPRCSVNQQAAQLLYWVAKYRLREMVDRCESDPCPAEVECRNMLVDAAKHLNYDLPDAF